MRNVILVSFVTVLGVGAAACSGSGYGSAPSAATAVGPLPNGIVTVNVVAINGAQSFSPNPATLPTGQKIVWHNIDSITHRVVLNDGTIDTGNLAPGASSAPMTIGTAGGAYHCSIHPEMIGSINQDTSSTPSTPAPTPY
jgi:plastocyanin